MTEPEVNDQEMANAILGEMRIGKYVTSMLDRAADQYSDEWRNTVFTEAITPRIPEPEEMAAGFVTYQLLLTALRYPAWAAAIVSTIAPLHGSKEKQEDLPEQIKNLVTPTSRKEGE